MFCCFSLDGCCHLVSSGWKSSSSFVIQMVSPVNQTTCLHYSSVRNAMKRSPPLLSLVIDVARKETRNKCRRRRRMTLRQSSDLWLPNKQRLQHGSHYIVPLYIPLSFLELWQVANEQHWRVKEKKEAFFFYVLFRHILSRSLSPSPKTCIRRISSLLSLIDVLAFSKLNQSRRLLLRPFFSFLTKSFGWRGVARAGGTATTSTRTRPAQGAEGTNWIYMALRHSLSAEWYTGYRRRL